MPLFGGIGSHLHGAWIDYTAWNTHSRSVPLMFRSPFHPKLLILLLLYSIGTVEQRIYIKREKKKEEYRGGRSGVTVVVRGVILGGCWNILFHATRA